MWGDSGHEHPLHIKCSNGSASRTASDNKVQTLPSRGEYLQDTNCVVTKSQICIPLLLRTPATTR